MKPAVTRQQAAQRVRWERMHVAIRCGLHATQPTLIRIYLGLGRWLVQRGLLDDLVANERMLRLLLDTARDEALPWFWRSVCLEHTAMPVARLTTLLKQQDLKAVDTVAARLRSAQLRLAAVAPSLSLREEDA
jgi:hypothetical protein